MPGSSQTGRRAARVVCAGPKPRMTSEGSAQGRFTRAIKARNLFRAEVAARELRGLSLVDALELVILIASQRPDRLDRAAVRWHGRPEVEVPTLTLAESRHPRV